MFDRIEKKCLFRAADPPGPATPARLPGILIVDPNPDVRSILAVCARRRGFHVQQAADGATALRSSLGVASGSLRGIDLVLADMNLPDVLAGEFLASLQRLAPHARVCFMGDRFSEQDRDDLVALGAVWVFPRPFPVEAVVGILWNLVHVRRPQGSNRAPLLPQTRP
jgi:DNA-binding response OmpR family regulator